MNATTHPHRPYEADPTPYVALFAMAVGIFVSAPAMLGGIALARLGRRATIAFTALAVAGAGFVWLSRARVGLEMHRAQRAGEHHRMFVHASESLHAAWPHIRTWWLLAAPLCFAVALAIAAFRRRSVEELRERDERRAERVRTRTERKARRVAGLSTRRERKPVFELGRHVGADRLLPISRGRVVMPLARLARTLLVIGAPGSGKTVTLGRLAYGVATTSDWQGVVIDAKGDPATQAAFAQMMHRAGRGVYLFPQEPYDAWRGTGREIANRLVQLIDWADEGGGAYYRDLSVNLVRLACTPPGGPPRSSDELLRRLDKAELMIVWAGHPRTAEIERFRDEHIDACRQRYRSFFDATAGQLDGSWAFEDADCAYVLLNELLYAEETGKLARLLVEDFKQYLAARNPDRRRVLLIVDEFSAIADGERTARMVEVVRSYGAAVVLAPQCLEGMGGPEATARILNSAHTIILHAVPEPEQIVKAAGTRMATEWSLQHERGLSHRRRFDPRPAPAARRSQRGPAPVAGYVLRDWRLQGPEGPDRPAAARGRPPDPTSRRRPGTPGARRAQSEGPIRL